MLEAMTGTLASEGAYVTDDELTPFCCSFSSNGDGYRLARRNQYYEVGKFLFGTTLATIVLFLITPSASGSLAVGLVAANSREAQVIQHIPWALTEAQWRSH